MADIVTAPRGNEFVTRILLDHHLVDEESVRRAEEARALRPEVGFVEALLNLGLMDEKRYLAAFGALLGLEVADALPVDDIDLSLIGDLPITWAKQSFVLPLRRPLPYRNQDAVAHCGLRPWQTFDRWIRPLFSWVTREP